MTPSFLAWASNTEDAIWVDLDALLNKDAQVLQDEDSIYVDLSDTMGLDAFGLADVLEGGAELTILSAHARGFKKKG